MKAIRTQRRFITDTLLVLAVLGALLSVAAASFRPGNVACDSNAALLQQAVLEYTQDNDELFPTATSLSGYQAAVEPYTRSASTFICPATQQPYQPNFALSGHSIAAQYPSTTELFRDSVPHGDGQSTVAFLDGRLERGGVDQADPEQTSVNDAKQLALAVDQYTQDNDEILPSMHTPAELQTALMPYTHTARVFRSPVTGLPFTPNPAVSGQPLSAFSDYGTTELLRDPRRHRNGEFVIAYLDGHVEGGDVAPANQDSACLSDESQLGLALIQYTQDYDGTLPPMHTPAELQSALMPYTRDSRTFRCPSTQQPYAPNGALSGHNVNDYASPSTTEVLRDAVPHSDGKVTTLYLDGHDVQQ